MNVIKKEIHLKYRNMVPYNFTVVKCVNHIIHLPGETLTETDIKNLIRNGVKVVINAS